MGKHIAFGWYGGKYSHLDWILPLLPYTKHYCEPDPLNSLELLLRGVHDCLLHMSMSPSVFTDVNYL